MFTFGLFVVIWRYWLGGVVPSILEKRLMNNVTEFKLTDTEAEKFETLLQRFLTGMPEIVIDVTKEKCDQLELNTIEAQHKYIVESFGNFLDAETEDTNLVIDTEWSDWRVAQGEEVDTCDSNKYQVKIEHHEAQNQVWFSIVQSNVAELANDDPELVPTGLCGLIEIREGVPAISLGFDENQNAIHVVSNTHNELEVTPDHADVTASYGKSVRFTQLSSVIAMNRQAVAHSAFDKYDFGNLTVTDTQGWSNEENIDQWVQNITLEDEQGNVQYGTIKVEFAQDLCLVLDVKYQSTEELRSKIANTLMVDADFEPLRVTDMGSWESDGETFSMTLHLEDDDCNKSKVTFWVKFSGNWSNDYEVSHR